MYYTHPCALAWSTTSLTGRPPANRSGPAAGREAGAIALLRDDGILLMTQGGHHRLGAWVLRQALIDRNDMKTVLKEQKEPFLWPELDWEMKGFTGDTTVANTLVPFKGSGGCITAGLTASSAWPRSHRPVPSHEHMAEKQPASALPHSLRLACVRQRTSSSPTSKARTMVRGR